MKKILLFFTLFCSALLGFGQDYIYVCGPFAGEQPPLKANEEFYESHKMYETSPGSGVYEGRFMFDPYGWGGFRFYTKLSEGTGWNDCVQYNTICPNGKQQTISFDEWGLFKSSISFWEKAPENEDGQYSDPSAWFLPGFQPQKPEFYYLRVDTKNNTLLVDNASTLFIVGGNTKGQFPTYEKYNEFQNVAVNSSMPCREINIPAGKFSLFYYSLAKNQVIMSNNDDELKWDHNIFSTVNSSVCVDYKTGVSIRPWRINDWEGRPIMATPDGFIDITKVDKLYLWGSIQNWVEPSDSNADKFSQYVLSETSSQSQIYRGTFSTKEFKKPSMIKFILGMGGYSPLNNICGDGKVYIDSDGTAIEKISCFNPKGDVFSFPEMKGDSLTFEVNLKSNRMTLLSDTENKSDIIIFATSINGFSDTSDVREYKDYMLYATDTTSGIYRGSFNIPHEKLDCYFARYKGNTNIVPSQNTVITYANNESPFIFSCDEDSAQWQVPEWNGDSFDVSIDINHQMVKFYSVSDQIYVIGSLNNWSTPTNENSTFLEDYALKATSNNVYEGTFSVQPGQDISFRFYTALNGWGNNEIGCAYEDMQFDYSLEKGGFSGPIYEGRGVWRFKKWASSRIKMKVDRNTNEITISDPDYVVVPDPVDRMFLMGDVTEWQTPKSNPELYELFTLQKLKDGIYEGTFNIPVNEATFYFCNTRDYEVIEYIAAETANGLYEHYLNNGVYSGSYVVNGNGPWKFPYWEGGYINIKLDTNLKTIAMSYGSSSLNNIDNADSYSIFSTIGKLHIMAPSQMIVNIYNLQGMCVKSLNINQGVTTIDLPSGLYIVNEKKIAIK